jgi:uncharacterized protein (DUF2461 family)
MIVVKKSVTFAWFLDLSKAHTTRHWFHRAVGLTDFVNQSRSNISALVSSLTQVLANISRSGHGSSISQ